MNYREQLVEWLSVHCGTDAIRGAEVGVLSGGLSSYLLEQLPTLHLLMIDAWPDDGGRYGPGGPLGGPDAKARAIAYTEPFADRRTVLHMASIEASLAIPDDSLDFVFIDGDHRYGPVRADLMAWYEKVKPRGLVCGHDYETAANCKWGVRKAVNEFVETLGIASSLIRGAETTWQVVKPG